MLRPVRLEALITKKRRAVVGAAVAFAAVMAVSSVARADDPTFVLDPVGDATLLTVSLGLGFAGQASVGTGAIEPRQIPVDFRSTDLPWVDRFAIHQTIDSSATTVATIGDGVALAFAVLHPVVSGFEHGKEAFFLDAAMYAETVSLTSTIGVITRVATRRNRPIAYMHRDDFIAHGGDPRAWHDDKVDDSMSFFSGHTATCAAVTATASYLMFARYPTRDIRPWLTLGVGTALTTFVAIERVRSGNHFPTDNLAGAAVGAAIGLLVVRAHRTHLFPQRPIWVGAAPTMDRAGGTLSVSGLF